MFSRISARARNLKIEEVSSGLFVAGSVVGANVGAAHAFRDRPVQIQHVIISAMLGAFFGSIAGAASVYLVPPTAVFILPAYLYTTYVPAKK